MDFVLLADKGPVTVVMDKTNYYDKMDELVNDKQTYELLKQDPAPSLQQKLNNKTNTITQPTYYQLRCSVPRSPKLYRLPKLHKPQIPMQPIVSFCGSPTYELSKYLTILQSLTNKSQHRLQSTETFINNLKTTNTTQPQASVF